MKNSQNVKLAILGIIALVLLIAVPLFLTYGDQFLSKSSPTERTIELLEGGVDTSNSLFSSGENRGFEEEIRISVAELEQGATITDEKALNLARILHDIKDYEKALVLYDIALELGSSDFLILVDKGDIYLAQGRYEEAAKQYEKAKIDFPTIYEIYIGQANAYKQIQDTPQYVVDDVYRQGISRIPGQYELYEAFIDWLEKTDRENETIEYYEILNKINPQPLLQERIDELKNKYE